MHQIRTPRRGRVARGHEPLDDRLVVLPDDPEEVTAGGIVLADSAQQKPQRGKVIATGPGKLLDNGFGRQAI